MSPFIFISKFEKLNVKGIGYFLIENTILTKLVFVDYMYNKNTTNLLKYQFWKKSLRKNATLSSWTLFQHICPHFWAWLLLYSAITPKSEDKYVVKVLNSTELHFSEVYFFQNWYFKCGIRWDWNSSIYLRIRNDPLLLMNKCIIFHGNFQKRCFSKFLKVELCIL